MVNKTSSTEKKFIIWTDGACEPNPGIGGWGARIEPLGGEAVEIYGGELETTNNRMEMSGVIYALRETPIGSELEIRTDSQYVSNGMNIWRHKWEKFGWKKSKNSTEGIKNLDLWQCIAALCNGRKVKAVWVRGHSGVWGNERADELAAMGRETVII